MNQLNQPTVPSQPALGLIIVVCVRPPVASLAGDFNGDGKPDLA